MKKTLAGGILALIGTIWAAAIMSAAQNNLVNQWYTANGRFGQTLSELGLWFPFILAVILTLFGVGVIVADLFGIREKIKAWHYQSIQEEEKKQEEEMSEKCR